MKRYLILCATDGSEAAQKATEFAAELARKKLGELLMMHVQKTHGSELMPEGLAGLERVEHIRVTEADMLHVRPTALPRRALAMHESAARRPSRAWWPRGIPPAGLSRRRGIAAPALS